MQKNLFLYFFLFQVFVTYGQADFNDGQIKNLIVHPQPLIVGHRGGIDSLLPENSIAVFDFSYTNSCEKPIGIELDIRKSASGSLFIMHDSNVDRTTNGQGEIALLPDSYIRSLFLKDWNGNLTSEKVPLFADVLLHFYEKEIVLMLDVKGSIYPDVIELITQMHMESKCIILTFNPENTRLVKDITGNIMISALVENKLDWETLRKLEIPDRQLIAYVNKKTPTDLITEINNSKVLLMTDMSESIRNNSKPYDPDFYKAVLTKMHLGIVITDFLLFVNQLFCE